MTKHITSGQNITTDELLFSGATGAGRQMHVTQEGDVWVALGFRALGRHIMLDFRGESIAEVANALQQAENFWKELREWAEEQMFLMNEVVHDPVEVSG